MGRRNSSLTHGDKAVVAAVYLHEVRLEQVFNGLYALLILCLLRIPLVCSNSANIPSGGKIQFPCSNPCSTAVQKNAVCELQCRRVQSAFFCTQSAHRLLPTRGAAHQLQGFQRSCQKQPDTVQGKAYAWSGKGTSGVCP